MQYVNSHRHFLFPTLFFLCMTFGVAFGQKEPAIQQLLSEGNTFLKQGNSAEAISKYNEALALDPKHDYANYLAALAYYNSTDFDRCISHCDNAINMFSGYEEEAYMLKGKALIKDGRAREAITNYNKMLLEYPENYLIYYNMATAYLNMGDNNDAESSLFSALSIQPFHAESHLLLGSLMIKEGESLKAVLALTNFLMLEPRGPRASEVYGKIQKQLPKAFGDIHTDMSSLLMATDANMNQFMSAEAMLAAVDGEKPMSHDGEVLAKNTQALFDRLALMKKEPSQWWDFYVSFFNDLNYNKHLETVSYFISQSQNLEETHAWMAEHQTKVAQMIDWVNDYDR